MEKHEFELLMIHYDFRDGGLKRSKPKQELMKIQQTQYSNTLIDLVETTNNTPNNKGDTDSDEPNGSTDSDDIIVMKSAGDDITQSCHDNADSLHKRIVDNFVTTKFQTNDGSDNDNILSDHVRTNNADIMDCLLGNNMPCRLDAQGDEGSDVDNVIMANNVQNELTSGTAVDVKKDV